MGFDTETLKTKTERVEKPTWMTWTSGRAQWKFQVLQSRCSSSILIVWNLRSTVRSLFLIQTGIGGNQLLRMATSHRGIFYLFFFRPTQHTMRPLLMLRVPHHADWLFLGATCCYHTQEAPLGSRNGELVGIPWKRIIQFSAVWQVHSLTRACETRHATRPHKGVTRHRWARPTERFLVLIVMRDCVWSYEGKSNDSNWSLHCSVMYCHFLLSGSASRTSINWDVLAASAATQTRMPKHWNCKEKKCVRP